jgi:hypothetical protein
VNFMAAYWLTPLTSEEPVTFGAQRIRCAGPQFETFRNKLHAAANPRFLLAFKADLLLETEGDEGVCGPGVELGVPLADGGAICFDDTTRLQLSHCAEAFLQRLPLPREWRTWFADQHHVWDEQEWQWLRLLQQWADHDWTIVLIKEG